MARRSRQSAFDPPAEPPAKPIPTAGLVELPLESRFLQSFSFRRLINLNLYLY